MEVTFSIIMAKCKVASEEACLYAPVDHELFSFANDSSGVNF